MINGNHTIISIGVLMFIIQTGCYTTPLQAIPSTIPLDTESSRLTLLGPAEGESCSANILFLIPVRTDGSIYTAKAKALASTGKRGGVGLIDVSIDEDSAYGLFYNEKCTIVRGMLVGYKDSGARSRAPVEQETPAAEEAAPEAKPPALDPDVAKEKAIAMLKEQRSAVMSCLASSYIKSDITVGVEVAGDGSVTNTGIKENLPRTVKECVMNVLKSVRYPGSDESYRVDYTYSFKTP